MIRGRDWIAARIPHQGSMCLLDGVLSFDAEHIVCEARGHGALDHPLRAGDGLGVAAGIEYAAQAMAVHGALLSEGQPGRSGYLASARDVQWQVRHLHDIPGPLEVRAERLSGTDNHVLYAFTVRGDGRLLLSGRTTVILNADT